MTHPTQTTRDRLLAAFDIGLRADYPLRDVVLASFRKTLDDYAHELAEKIRVWAPEHGGAEEYGSHQNVLDAADLIDPEAKG